MRKCFISLLILILFLPSAFIGAEEVDKKDISLLKLLEIKNSPKTSCYFL